MELSDYIRTLRKNWLVILATTLIGLAAAAGYSLTRTPMYESQAVVFVQSQGGGTAAELQQGSNFAQARITTYVSLVREPVVMNPVITELNLNSSASELAARVKSSSPLNSTLIEITVQDGDPVQAAEIANALGDSLAAAVERIDTPAGQEAPIKLTRVRDALASFEPVSPNVALNVALGVLIGLALGVGVAILRTVLDNRVRSPRDIESLTNRPLIGAIPHDPKTKERPIILQADPQNPRSEAFRALRTNLQFLEMDGGHTFVVTSSIPTEGKSTTTINLAIALADSGKRVALLDTDLRKPKVAEYLGIEGGTGLTDVLIGRARVADVLLPWGGRSLYVLPAGKIPPNPSELLGSERMQKLLEALGQEFDVVLCDAPPLLPVTDAAVLSRATSGAIMVVAVGKTTTHQLDGAFEALETVGSKVAGVVMTMVPTKGADAYTYGYGYGYGGYGVYNAEPKKTVKPKRTESRSGKTKSRGRETQPPDDPSATFDELLNPR
ncbi:capsular exopolysaccharide synthesis family protein [Microbacterium ginsengiterrae]|uniref:non-specific protein-tyrosine kinase n=1 Tax=Microbacterium ginsengiterrae TaxID=546115 RepID=A0A7W9CD61_9MICO|nr:polysaccharide biosynthesis tyrosine autokinase [Microbacterium ginsengiterrae]MBB5743404.1 capsular exopolysaccharide synthesis family protein [Microbacterium ginsengiterrae]